MRTLIVARHAKAEPASADGRDHGRALSLKGRKAASTLGTALVSRDITPDVVLVSDALRTQQTWQILSQGWDEPEVNVRAELYNATVGSLHKALTEITPEAMCVMYVGHEPTASATVAFLANAESNQKAMKRAAHGLQTGTAAIFTFDGEWSDLGPRSAQLVEIVGRGD